MGGAVRWSDHSDGAEWEGRRLVRLLVGDHCGAPRSPESKPQDPASGANRDGVH